MSDERVMRTLNRLTKWRKIFASWQLGSRSDTDPEAAAVRDHREVTILLRVEVTSVVRLLLEKGLFTIDELQAVVVEEAEALEGSFETKFPGMKARDYGIDIDQVGLRFIAENFPP